MQSLWGSPERHLQPEGEEEEEREVRECVVERSRPVGAAQFYLILLVEQDELGVGQDAELPVPGAAVGVRALTAGESVSRRTFNIWKQK